MYPAMAAPADTFTLQLPLGERDLHGFSSYRRGRRRMHEIRLMCPGVSYVKLNKALGTLEITGTAEGLELARIKVAEVTGPLKQLSPAVWSELMRTRKQEGPGATTSELQRFSGCRLHLDRESCAVRIFGPEEVVATAEKLLDNLAKACEEHLLNVKSDDLDEEMLQKIACATCVSARIQNTGIYLMGFESLVRKATGEVQRYLRDPESYQLPDIMDAQQLVEVAVQHLPVTSPETPSTTTDPKAFVEHLPAGGLWAATGTPMVSMPAVPMSVPNWTLNTSVLQYYNTIPFQHPGYPAYPTPSAASAFPIPSAFSQGSLSQPIYGSPLNARVMSPMSVDMFDRSAYYSHSLTNA